MDRTLNRRCCWIAIAFLAGSLSAGAAEIAFMPQAEVRGSLVLLGDLADVQDPDPREVDRLKRIELFPTPARGRHRVLRDVELRQLLQLHGVTVSDHKFAGAESVRIGSDTKPAGTTRTQEETKQDAQVSAVVAKRAIAAGELLRAVDVELKTFDQLHPNLVAVTGTESVVGREAIRAIPAGEPIDARSLRKPILVRRGDLVVVVAKAAGVRVRTTAKATAEGAHGDVIQLEADGNRKVFSAVVTGLREAEVFASGTTVTGRPITSASNTTSDGNVQPQF